jgi:putative sigma-54 modulation protein
MKIHIVARKIKLTKPIKDFIESKVEKIYEFINNIVWIQVVISVEKKVHSAEIVVHVGHQTMKASASSDDLYSAIDKVMDKIETQVKRYKERSHDYRNDDVYNYKEIPAPISPEIRFSVIKEIPIRPMHREDAVVEMEKLGYNFWLFLDKKTKQMHVVFKRLDNSYGLIQPVKK